ncbi:MoaD/ThiS family protein [Demequina gelatinilytica]|uniref:MoaD/ThiS family protein n=1 Tax=Demequina gelatinilytica TaxID=1638980 RepID=UPI000B11935A|nr:MoaD/ThiS family protein [Demequina gelatinilytica]
MIAVRLFAAAAEACGAEELALDAVQAGSAGSLRATLAGHGPEAPRVIAQCALLRAGERLEDDAALASGDLVDVLPPFAGG